MDNGEWIRLEEWCERYGEIANTVHKRIQEDLWPRGEYAACPDGIEVYIHEARGREWLSRRGKLVL